MKHVRLTESCTPDERELAAAIRAVRAEQSNAKEIAALAQKLAPQLAAPALVRPGFVSLGTSAKWLVSLVLAVGLGMFAALQFEEREPQVAPRVVMPEPVVSVTTPAAVIEPPQEPEESIDPVRPVAPKVVRPKPSPPPRAALPPRAANPEAELQLVSRAQRALEPEPRRALALAEEHAASYPRGLFTQEREMLAIQALLKLKQRAAAVARAKEFLANYPTSPHARHLRPLVE